MSQVMIIKRKFLNLMAPERKPRNLNIPWDMVNFAPRKGQAGKKKS
jgi:hypothetical protein